MKRRTTVGLLLDFWVASDFPSKIHVDGFVVRRVTNKYKKLLQGALKDHLSHEDKQRWEGCRYALFHSYVPASTTLEEEEKDLQPFHRFTQLLRIIRPNTVICDVMGYDGKLPQEKSIRRYLSDPRRMHPADHAATDSIFTLQDARKIKKYHRVYSHSAATTEYDRLATAFYFFETQFHSPTPRIKVVGIVAALEALFNTSNGETAFKIAIRCASFLGRSSAERYEIFRNVKSIYDLRSKVAHGQPLSNGIYKNPKVGVNLIILAESYVRKCLAKIIEEDYTDVFGKKQSDLEAAFDRFVLGVDRKLGRPKLVQSSLTAASAAHTDSRSPSSP
jgi:hypothetical protein